MTTAGLFHAPKLDFWLDKDIYIIPDNDYLMFYGLGWSAFTGKVLHDWGYDHYAELLSPGPRAGSAFAEAFAGLVGQEAP